MNFFHFHVYVFVFICIFSFLPFYIFAASHKKIYRDRNPGCSKRIQLQQNIQIWDEKVICLLNETLLFFNPNHKQIPSTSLLSLRFYCVIWTIRPLVLMKSQGQQGEINNGLSISTSILLKYFSYSCHYIVCLFHLKILQIPVMFTICICMFVYLWTIKQ